MQNVFQKQSIDLASRIQTQFTERVDRKDRGVKQSGFWVLFNTSMPAVLVETGFISNPVEEKFLNSVQGQDYLASAIFRACRDYLNEIDMKSITSTGEPVVKSDSEVVPLPENKMVFMIQVATSGSRKEVKPENFKGISDIQEISTQNRYRYATGRFSEYSDAVQYRKKIEAIYPDAFVIAVKDNKVLPLQQALEQKRKK